MGPSWTGKFGQIEPSGFVITNRFLYHKLRKKTESKYKTGKIPLASINEFQIKIRYDGWMVINKRGYFQLIWLGILAKREAKAIELLMNEFVQHLNV